MEYKPLAKEFNKKGFTYKQIWREGDFAIYSQTLIGSSEEPHYESIKIERHNGYTIAGAIIPPSEIYPNSEAWGIKGFTLFSKAEAFAKIDWMKNHVDEIQLKNKEVDPETGHLVRKPSLKLPDGEFSIKLLGELNKDIKTHNLYPAIKKLIAGNKIKETRREANKRGKATAYFIKI